MSPGYTSLSWGKSRRIVSTAIGVAIVGAIVCGAGYRVVMPITLNSGARPWSFTTPTFCSIGLALLLTLNTLPVAPEWEQPLRHRTRVAHCLAWLLVACLGSTGPIIAAMRLASTPHASNWSIVSFYVTTVGLAGCLIALLGRTAGSVALLGLVAGVIAIEQATARYAVLADIRAQPAWTVAAGAMMCAVAVTYRSGGHKGVLFGHE